MKKLIYNKEFSDNQRYISLSPKYANHLKKNILNHNKQVKFTFLHGAAGSGKSLTLEWEFLRDLKSKRHIVYFTFLPDKHLHNHLFLKEIGVQLLEYYASIAGNTSTYNELKKEISKNNDQIVFSKNFHHAVLKFLQTLPEGKIIFSFEDVHLSGKYFADFLCYISKVSLDLNILCTTRKNKKQHEFKIHGQEFWLSILPVRHNTLKKFCKAYDTSMETLGIPDDFLLDISNGNPFLIREIALLNKQLGKTKKFKEKVYSNFLSENAYFTLRRFENLTKAQQEILKILCIVGIEYCFPDFKKILYYIEIDYTESDFEILLNYDFIGIKENNLYFKHHLIYETIETNIPHNQKILINKKIFFILRSSLKSRNLEALAKHSTNAELQNYACYYNKKFALALMEGGQYELAAQYLDKYISAVVKISDGYKLKKRLIDVYFSLHSCCIILGNRKKSKEISKILVSVSEQLAKEDKLATLSAITSAYMLSDLETAEKYALRVVQASDDLRNREYQISSKARYGNICLEKGSFHGAVEFSKKAEALIKEGEKNRRFGLFPYAFFAVNGVKSISYAELGSNQRSREINNLMCSMFDDVEDNFTKLFISVHIGYSLILEGNFSQALSLLEKGMRASRTTKANLLTPTCYALIGYCYLMVGDKELSKECIINADILSKKSHEQHKRGLYNLILVERRLITFDLDNFEEFIDSKIDETYKLGHLSFVAWLYFIKALYFCFFKKSIKGFVGSFAKSSMIAHQLDMKLLSWNLNSLGNLEKSKIVARDNDDNFDLKFFNKAKYYHDLTSNIDPIFFHKKTLPTS